MSKEIGGFIATNQAEKSGMGRARYDGGRNGYSHPARVVSLHQEIRNQYMSNLNVTTMKETTKRTMRRIIDIVITVLTALVTALTTNSCMGG